MEPAPTHAACSACGTGAINHRVAYAMNIADEVFVKTLGVFFSRLPIPQESRFASAVQAFMFTSFSLVGLMRFNTDREKAASGRSKLIWDEAARRGIDMRQIVLAGKYLDQYRARVGGRTVYFESLPIPPWLAQHGYAWVDDKLKLAKELHKAGIPAPQARVAASWPDTAKAFAELSKPVIIKPRIGSRGRHTTTNINTLEELKTAYELAKQIARELVIEEHLFGSVCRATVVGGKLVGFFKADPPHVVGDGVHTIHELISLKNETRHERVGAMTITDDVLSFIARRGYTPASVLPKGEVLDLTAKTGRFYGGATREMLPEVHQKMHELFKKAGEVVHAPVVGFDCIIVDPTADPDGQRWGIIECNSLPFIDLHYFALEGKPNDIAPHIWDLWKK